MEGLPIEIIREIKSFYQVPEINIKWDKSECYLCIKHNSMTIELSMVAHAYFDKNRGIYDTIDEFIDQLSTNENCTYERSYFSDEDFSIEVNNDVIKINSGTVYISLPKESKNRLVDIMKEFSDILNKNI